MNRLPEYTLLAQKFINELKKNPQVEGVMNLGGIARGFADEHSDIDVAVFSKKKIKGLVLGEQLTKEGYDLEVFNILLNEDPNQWSSIQKEAYQEGTIAFDRRGLVKKFLQKALYYSATLRKKKMVKIIFDIGWHGWIYTPYRMKKMKGYNWILPEDLWFQRNHEINAYYLTQKCLFDFIELLYSFNKRFAPDFKWRLVKSFDLAKLPSEYVKKMDYLVKEKWSKSTWSKKRSYFQSMIDEVIPWIIPELPENWYKLLE
jgi:predicted nucleotidyltransferase